MILLILSIDIVVICEICFSQSIAFAIFSSIFLVVVDAIVCVSICYLFIYIFSVENMLTTFDDCDILEKVIDLTNLHRHDV